MFFAYEKKGKVLNKRGRLSTSGDEQQQQTRFFVIAGQPEPTVLRYDQTGNWLYVAYARRICSQQCIRRTNNLP